MMDVLTRRIRTFEAPIIFVWYHPDRENLIALLQSVR